MGRFMSEKNEKTYRIYWIAKPSNMRGESAELMDYATAKASTTYLNKKYNGKNGNELIIHHFSNYNYVDKWVED